MIKIDVYDIQVIGSASIELPENSIIEFTGDNSNGKSVITKLLTMLLNGDIRNESVRRALIKDGKERGVFLMTHNKEQLGVVITPHIGGSIVMYNSDCGNQETMIVRQLNDIKGCEALIHKFGFRCYNNGEVCLQIHPTWGPIPFITTSGQTNYEIVEDITVDKIADEFLKTFKDITFPSFKNSIKRLKNEKENITTILDNMESYDWRAYEEISQKIKPIYSALSKCDFIEIENIPIPNLNIVPVNKIEINNIPIVTGYDYAPTILTIGKELDDYLEIVNGICPTCGKPLV